MERRNKKLLDTFARVLSAKRREAGLSQEELAFRLELSVSYISLLETRKRQPTLTVLAAIASELGMSLSELMREIETAR